MSFFGGFPGFGGGGFGGGHGHAADNEPVDTEGLYRILGVEKNASPSQIKKAFRRLAMTHHPDKGGDPEVFKEAQKAYEILSDPEKKELYDQYGEKGVENGGPSGAGDLFDLFSGRMSGRGRGGRKRKGQDVVFPLKVDLETLYNGGSKKLRLTRNVICASCHGAGGKDGKSPEQCGGCRGAGVRVVVRQLGPGMIQQMQTQCPDCDGQGSVMREEDKCRTCGGKRTVKEKKLIEVFVPRGTENHHKFYFRGEADQSPDSEPGDVVVVVEQRKHPQFQRDGPNLILTKNIPLVDALCGVNFSVRHLDGRFLQIASKQGQVIKPNMHLCVPEEGMPYPRNPFTRGSLFVVFKVEFPDDGQLLPGALLMLQRALPKSVESMDTVPDGHEPEHKTLEAVDDEAERRRLHDYRAANKEAYEEDEEGEGGPSVGCRTQ